MSERRTLAFASLDEVMPEVDRLLAGGYTTVGNWSLGQICNHLSATFRGSVKGIPFKAPWFFRTVIAPFVKQRIFRTGQMREGVKLPDVAIPKPGLDDRAEADSLRAALRLYAAHTGPVADHPFFGPMTREEWTRLHCIHCAHHLSFARPNAGT